MQRPYSLHVSYLSQKECCQTTVRTTNVLTRSTGTSVALTRTAKETKWPRTSRGVSTMHQVTSESGHWHVRFKTKVQSFHVSLTT